MLHSKQVAMPEALHTFKGDFIACKDIGYIVLCIAMPTSILGSIPGWPDDLQACASGGLHANHDRLGNSRHFVSKVSSKWIGNAPPGPSGAMARPAHSSGYRSERAATFSSTR